MFISWRGWIIANQNQKPGRIVYWVLFHEPLKCFLFQVSLPSKGLAIPSLNELRPSQHPVFPSECTASAVAFSLFTPYKCHVPRPRALSRGYFPSYLFPVFTNHVIKNKNREHSTIKFKNLGYDRWLQYKQTRQESGLLCFSSARYLHECVIQIYRASYGDAMFCPVVEFAIEMKILPLELRHIEINASSCASTV